MIAGVSWVWWVGFHAAVAALLLADSQLPGHRRESGNSQTFAWLWTAFLVLAATGFAAWIAVSHGRQTALEWVGGYAIETSLSVDNLFVFLVIFQGFRISVQRQHNALLWGVGGSANAAIPEWIRKLQPAKGSLLPVILAIEITDILFAVDSIPAVLAISHDPFVVYTSNIAAILGLRSLYFAVASLLDRFRYLHYGLGAMLAFVAFKMLAARWIDVPIVLSLAIMGTILTVCAVVSWMAGNRDQGSGTKGLRD